MLPILRILGFSIQTPLLALLCGYALAVWLASRQTTRICLNGAVVSDAGFYGALAGLLGARAGYVIQNAESYLREPLSALLPSATALDTWIGLAVGVGFALIYLKKRSALDIRLLDATAYGIPLLLIGIAIASLCSGSTFGTPAQLPWSIYLWDAWRHPVQIYECIALTLILMVLFVSRRFDWPSGARFVLLLAMYAFARVIIDGFRADVETLATLRVTQLVGVTISTFAVWLLGRLISSPVSKAINLGQSDTENPLPE